MSLTIVPEISFGDLEKILKHLPEPTSAEVALFGRFDYSSAIKQAEEKVQGLNISDKGGNIFRVNNPTKQLILDIYRKSEDTKRADAAAHYGSDSRRVDFHEAEWYIGKNVHIKLSSWDVSIDYPSNSLEPDYITNMRREIATTKVPITLTIGR